MTLENQKINSRERCLAAIRRQQTDRTPRDFQAEPPALNRLFAYLGHSDEQRLLRQLDVDIRHINANFPSELEIAAGVFQNFWGERYKYKDTPWGKMREDMPGALAGATTLDELKEFHWPSADSFDYSDIRRLCRQYKDYAIIYGFADIWQRPALVRGWENMFIGMVEHPDWVHLLCRKFTDFYIEDYTRAARTCPGQIDIFLVISDLGGQDRPLISLEMFREFVAPYLKEMVEHIHRLGAFVMFHSCGNIHSFIEDFIEIGIDILDPIQPVTPEMSPERLKADYGDRLCFHGGIDLQRVLSGGSPEQVASEVRRYCKILGDNGGYILAPCHLFQPDIPPENILAFYSMPEI